MIVKKFSLWVGLVLIVVIIPLAYASGLLSQVKPDDLGELSRGRYKLMSMIAGCEMDNKCMQVTLIEMIKRDPHPVYENFLSGLNENKDQIEYEQMHCNTPVIRTYRREITACIAVMLKEINPKAGISVSEKNKVESKMNTCIKNKMETMAKAGNIYAQATLMEQALKNKDMPSFERWYNAMQLQQTKLEFSTYRKCQHPIQMFELFKPQR